MVAYSFKERFVAPIEAGLGRRDDARPKRQTIRAIGKRRHARPGEVLHLYYGMRTKQCRLIGVVRCSRSSWVTIWPDKMIIQTNGRVFKPRELLAFARADGFDDAYDMQAFWLKEHGPEKFHGVLIEWEPIA